MITYNPYNSKDCAIAYYTFGHEMAHIMGADHDRPNTPAPFYPEGTGELILGTNVRTIMA